MTLVVALHGDGGSGELLRRDMGNPSWVDLYPDWKRNSIDHLRHVDRLIVIGYSSGGSMAGHLTVEHDDHGERVPAFENIAASVLYESPLIGIDDVGGDFPALMIWNNRGASKRWFRKREAADTQAAWAKNHPLEVWEGNGRHWEFTHDWPPFRHGWDRSLNNRIRDWIKRHR
jgi:hypothetical protein